MVRGAFASDEARDERGGDEKLSDCARGAQTKNESRRPSEKNAMRGVEFLRTLYVLQYSSGSF